MNEEQIYADWTSSGLRFALTEHEPVFTVEQSAAVHDTVPGRHTKNLFLKDNRGQHWLVVLPADQRADLKGMAAVLGSGKLSFASADAMLRLLDVTPGSVSPLAALSPAAQDVIVVFDAALAGAGNVAVHPLRNSATVNVDFAELVGWMSARGRPPRVAKLT